MKSGRRRDQFHHHLDQVPGQGASSHHSNVELVGCKCAISLQIAAKAENGQFLGPGILPHAAQDGKHVRAFILQIDHDSGAVLSGGDGLEGRVIIAPIRGMGSYSACTQRFPHLVREKFLGYKEMDPLKS